MYLSSSSHNKYPNLFFELAKWYDFNGTLSLAISSQTLQPIWNALLSSVCKKLCNLQLLQPHDGLCKNGRAGPDRAADKVNETQRISLPSVKVWHNNAGDGQTSGPFPSTNLLYQLFPPIHTTHSAMFPFFRPPQQRWLYYIKTYIDALPSITAPMAQYL